MAQLEAQRASIVASLADAEGALATASAAYRAAVGHDAATLSPDVRPPALLPQTLSEARLRAETKSPLLLEQRQEVEAATARIDQARAERAPAVDLTGQYGLSGRLASNEVQDTVATASVGLALRIPLLTGGLVSSRIRQAEAIARSERFEAEAAEREARRSADAAWASLTAAEGRLRAASDGLAAADLV